MNRTEIEKALRNTVSSAPQLSFEQLAAMPYVKMQEHDYITKQDVVKSTERTRQYSYAAAFCLALLVLFSGWYFTNRVSSVITLDVNPSIEIKANLSDRVLSVRAINEDAAAILGDNDYKGKRLGEVVPLLMNSLIEHQYLNTEHNAILLTVTNKNNKKADVLRSKVDAAIRESLMSYNIAPTIMSQKLSKETERTKLAGQYGLSEGKLSLIQDLIAANPSFTIDSLAGKSVSQLYNLAKDNSVDLNKYFIREEDKGSYIKPGKTKTEDTGEVKTPEDNNTQGGSDTEDNGTINSDPENNNPESNNSESEIGNSDQNKDQEIEGQNQQGDNEDNNRGDKGEDKHSSRSDNNGKKHKSKDGSVPASNTNKESHKEDNQGNEETGISGKGDKGSGEDSQVTQDSGEDGDQQGDAGSGDSLNENDNEDQQYGEGNYDAGNGGDSGSEDRENNYNYENGEEDRGTMSEQDNQGTTGDYQDGGTSNVDNQGDQNED